MVSLIVFILILALVYWLLMKLPVPAPFDQIILVVLVICAIVAVLQTFGLIGGNIIPAFGLHAQY